MARCARSQGQDEVLLMDCIARGRTSSGGLSLVISRYIIIYRCSDSLFYYDRDESTVSSAVSKHNVGTT